MPVYMIRAGENGPVKIGHSSGPKIRLSEIQVSHWETLRIIRLFEGGEAEEFALHEKFAHLFIRGEWYSFSTTMMDDVGLRDITPTIHRNRSAGAEYADLMAPIRSRRGLAAKVAEGLGISKGAVSMWDKVPAERISDVARISGLTIQQLRPDLFAVSNDGGVR